MTSVVGNATDPLVTEKLIGLGATLAGGVLGSLAPLAFQGSLIGLALADAFAGGVFLSVALVHMVRPALPAPRLAFRLMAIATWQSRHVHRSGGAQFLHHTWSF